MRKCVWLVAIAFALACVPYCYADTIATFDISGTATNVSGGTLGSCVSGATCAFSGTFKVDITDGIITSLGTLDLTLPGLPVYNYVGSSQELPPLDWSIIAINNAAFNGESLFLNFSTTTPGSLVGFDGGSIFLSTVFNNVTGGFTYENITGSITPATTATPEPKSIALMLTGLVAFGLIAIRRSTINPRSMNFGTNA